VVVEQKVEEKKNI